VTFTIPFTVMILRDAFGELPIELEESALVDGCTPFQTLSLDCPALWWHRL
jgi:ABC-type glycerol-3-phosphate transport system permease component